MRYLKKIQLGKKSAVADDVKVTLMNEKVKTGLLQKKIDYENAMVNHKRLEPTSLLERLWPTIEHYTKTRRQQAVKLIKKLDATPSLSINDNLEMIYNGDVIRGTNIVQLIRSEVTPRGEGGRILLPGQDLFEHVLVTAPTASSSTPNKKKEKKA